MIQSKGRIMGNIKGSRRTDDNVHSQKDYDDTRSMTIIGIIVVTIIIGIIGIIGFSIWRSNQPITVSATPSFVASDGAIVITKNGIARNGRKYDNVTTGKTTKVVSDYQDFLCPGCAAVNQEIATPLKTYIRNGSIILKQYPISILDRLSNSTEYSTRLAAMAYRVAELDPDHYLDFVDLMFSDEVQPDEENFKNITDSQLVKYAIKAGLSKSDAKKSIDGKYTDYVTATTKTITADTSLWRDSGNGEKVFMTPIVRVNGKDLDYSSNTDFGTQLAKRLGVTKVKDGDGTD